jgi:ferrous iron transport protein B
MASFLDPLARVLGFDGTVLMAFILGLPANEIVLPIIVMAYLSQGALTEPGSLTALGDLLAAHGWTTLTAVCVMLFSLLHWPCGTTLWTVYRETQSWRWTVAAALIPTATAMVVIMLLRAAVWGVTCVMSLLSW